MSLIKKEPQKVNIPLYYLEKKLSNGFNKIIILDDTDALKKMEDEKLKKDVLVLNTEWKVLNWKEQNEITKSSTKHGSMGDGADTFFDYYLYRDSRLKRCLSGWDLKDDAGIPVMVTPQNIDLLPPEVVLALLNKFDTLISISPDEEKK
jgi:hypothetical protein